MKNLGAKFVKIYVPNGLASFASGLASSSGGLALSAKQMKPVCWRMKPVCQRMKPVLFVLLFFPSSFFFLSATRVLPSQSVLKTAFYENLC